MWSCGHLVLAGDFNEQLGLETLNDTAKGNKHKS